MMLCLALRSSPERVYHRALRQFSLEEITEAFAATRGLAIPSQLRHLLRERGRDLHAEFLALLPQRPRPVSIQRWDLRRVGLAQSVPSAALVPCVQLVPGRLDPADVRARNGFSQLIFDTDRAGKAAVVVSSPPPSTWPERSR